MSCSVSMSKPVDVEDLVFTENETVQKIKETFPTLEKAVYDIYDWVSMMRNKYDNDGIILKHFHRKYVSFLQKYRTSAKKNHVLFVYRQMVGRDAVIDDPIMYRLLQKRPSRNLSGVTIITLLTSPTPDGQNFSCKHNCYYCPNEPGQPRSYLKKEPAVARANRNEFDAIRQMNDRMHSLLVNGHELDKLEIILEGGTYTEYPPQYLERFHRDLIYAANVYFDTEKRSPKSVEEEVSINKSAKVRIIGICIETRPDALVNDNEYKNMTWLRRFRRWGVTRVQLGVQHSDNEILKKVNRGHTIEDACKAVQYLKDNCFKVDIHLMPDLPNATPEKDIQMFDFVFRSKFLQPDQAKIYPCEVTPWTVIQKWYESGKYKPYSEVNERDLFEVVKYAMKICPPWVRLPRVIRDIPLTYIEAGNKYPNLRQMLTDELEKEGGITMDIRARECGRHPEYDIRDAVYKTRTYETIGGTEYFISLESSDEKVIFGFTRLRIPDYESDINLTEFDCIKGMGLIRELHVYGNLVPVGYRKDDDQQHKGVGKQLISIAESIARNKGMKGTVVISGIGVMGYYEKLGYKYVDTFMVKEFNFDGDDIVIALILMVIIVFIAKFIGDFTVGPVTTDNLMRHINQID
jgi:ELP3 family radical SAM enzyme/protein acetyltransferase